MIRNIKNAFASGIITRELAGRTDYQKYANAAFKIKNFLLRPFGGANKRTGFKYVAETKDSSKESRLIEFEYSDEQAYIIEFGDQYMRFFANNGQLVDDADDPYEIVTPFLEDDLFDIDTRCQSADIVYFFHKDYAPRQMVRTVSASAPGITFTLSEIGFEWGPFRDQNTVEAHTLNPSSTTGAITLTSSSNMFNSGHIGSQWGLHSGYCEITSVGSSTTANATVGATLTASTATYEWSEGAFSEYRGYPATGDFFDDRLCLAGGAEPQMVWGSNVGDYYNHKAGTEDDDAWRHRIGSQKANPIIAIVGEQNLLVFTIGGEWWFDGAITPSNAIRKRQASRGSAKNIFPLPLGDQTLFLQRPGKVVRSFKYELDYNYTSRNLSLLPGIFESSRITDWTYQQYPNQIIWGVVDGEFGALTFDEEQESAGWHSHDTEGNFESVAVVPTSDEDQLWAIINRTINGATKRYIEYLTPTFLEDTTFDAFFVDSGLTYDGVEHNITGASLTTPVTLTVPGWAASVGDFTRISGIYASGTTELNNKVYEIVGATNALNIVALGDTVGASMTVYTGGGIAKIAKKILTGLGHLVTETVDILADGGTQPSQTVIASGTDGYITLPTAAGTAHAGLSYTADIEPVPIEASTQFSATIQGIIKRITSVTLKVYKSFGGFIGPDADNLRELNFWKQEDYYDGSPPELATEDITGDALPFSFELEGTMLIRHSDPLPFNVLSIITEVEI